MLKHCVLCSLLLEETVPSLNYNGMKFKRGIFRTIFIEHFGIGTKIISSASFACFKRLHFQLIVTSLNRFHTFCSARRAHLAFLTFK